MSPYIGYVKFKENGVKQRIVVRTILWDIPWYRDASDSEIRAAVLNVVKMQRPKAVDVQIESYTYDEEKAVAYRRGLEERSGECFEED